MSEKSLTLAPGKKVQTANKNEILRATARMLHLKLKAENSTLKEMHGDILEKIKAVLTVLFGSFGPITENINWYGFGCSVEVTINVSKHPNVAGLIKEWKSLAPIPRLKSEEELFQELKLAESNQRIDQILNNSEMKCVLEKLHSSLLPNAGITLSVD